MKTDARKEGPLDTVTAGGWFVMVVNVCLSPDESKDVRSEVIDIMAEETSIDSALIEPQVILKDANDLGSAFANNPFILHADTRALLKLPLFEGLADTDEWLARQRHERGLPSFISDELRNGALHQLESLIAGESKDPRVVWVWGPPGAGKTRLVAEAIDANATARMRALFSEDFEYGIRAIRSDDIPRRSGALLIVDECPRDEVSSLAASFMARAAGQGGTLVLIGPQSGAGALPGFVGTSLHVEPLDHAAARQLIEQELGLAGATPVGLVERVQHLTEGYPWFAVLLARALRADPSALPDGSTDWDAAALAIAGPKRDYGGNAAAWDAEVMRRSKTLLAVILTEGIDWNGLTQDDADHLGLAVDLQWTEVTACALVCAERGIIRVRQAWRFKYVTPNNLARLVTSRLLSGPHTTAQRLRQHAPQHCDALYRRLELLEVQPALLESLAERVLQPFVSAPLADLATLPLMFLAKHKPAEVARTLREAIEATPLTDLKDAGGIRRNLVFALNHICRRREGFENAERALFRLALAENETWSNNATGVWTDLFLGALSLTHRAFGRRLSILEDRIGSGAEASRMLALKGLERAVGDERIGPGYTDEDKVDGDWPVPTIPDVQVGKKRAWKLLLELTNDSVLGAGARAVVSKSLWSAAQWGVAETVFREVADRVPHWTEKERADLRETLRNLLAGEQGAAPAALALATALEPLSYRARLLDVVGQWMPAAARSARDHWAAERELDRELALSGLSRPDRPLKEELDWLETEEAVRAETFMTAVGAVDEERLLLPDLLSRAAVGLATRTLPAYLGGMSEAGAEIEVDELLRSWRGLNEYASYSLSTVWRLGPNDERISWLTEDIAEGRVDPAATGILAFGSWSARASPDQMRRLITVLAARGELTPRLAALWIALDDFAPSSAADAAPIIARLVSQVATEPLTGMGSYKWREACLWLARHEFADEAAAAALTAIRAADRYGTDDDAWAVVKELTTTNPEAIWSGLARIIDESPEDAYRIVLEAQSAELASALPAARILDWVGTDVRKSLLAAHMCRVHDAQIPELPAALLERFGPEGPTARELAARAHSTPGVVNSIAGFSKLQLENAKSWARDRRPAVAAWGAKLVDEMQSSYEYHAAAEEFEERQRL